MALNALKSLQSYGSDLSDNDESDDQNVINPLIAPDLNNMQSIAADPIMDKSKEKLPLPSSMLSMFPSSDSHPTNDDKEQHGGRIRSFPHMRGNWASFVHIPLNNSQNVICQIEHIKNVVVDIPDLEFHFCEDLHLSLSKTVVLRHHWIDSFLSTLKNNVTQINRFNLVYLTFQTYVNEEKTRTFISMNVHPSPQLYELVDASDRALAEYELPTYYEDPSFHVSLCWMVGDQSNFLKSVIPLINSKWRTLCENEPNLQFDTINEIWFKTGNRLCTFNLN
ncbi:U6 snRNA phosphodiesterase isoform X2 [Folsomia candida]|nr:U6 snRNA phosphodiesterase isoform X2 [Folsomia candida]